MPFSRFDFSLDVEYSYPPDIDVEEAEKLVKGHLWRTISSANWELTKELTIDSVMIEDLDDDQYDE